MCMAFFGLTGHLHGGITYCERRHFEIRCFGGLKTRASELFGALAALGLAPNSSKTSIKNRRISQLTPVFFIGLRALRRTHSRLLVRGNTTSTSPPLACLPVRKKIPVWAVPGRASYVVIYPTHGWLNWSIGWFQQELAHVVPHPSTSLPARRLCIISGRDAQNCLITCSQSPTGFNVISAKRHLSQY